MSQKNKVEILQCQNVMKIKMKCYENKDEILCKQTKYFKKSQNVARIKMKSYENKVKMFREQIHNVCDSQIHSLNTTLSLMHGLYCSDFERVYL